jgi:hypothetical protein
MNRTVRARVGTVAVVAALLSGCAAEADTPQAAQPPVRAVAKSTGTTAAAAQPADPGFIDVAALPSGAPPKVDSVADGVLRRGGRAVRTDLPADAAYLRLLGVVDGRVVVHGMQVDATGGERFWAVDAAGHAERLGGSYESYTYTPELVQSTAHIWVHHENRTTPRTIWELDARTGREIAAYAHNRVPHGLAPADQALVDAWVQRRPVVPDTEARTRDGSLRAVTRSVNPAAGVFGDSVVVRRVSDRTVLGQFTFRSRDDGVDRVVFEDRSHVLVLVTVSYSRKHGYQQAIVRCSLTDGTCERATDVGGNMALGVHRPLFEPLKGS